MSAAACDWMPFYGEDFFESESIAGMDDSALGLYLWLLWRQWRHGPLPGPNVLRRLNHRWQARWDDVWPQVTWKFDLDDDGRLVNQKLAALRAEAAALVRSLQERGRMGGRAKAASSALARLELGHTLATSQAEKTSPSQVPPLLSSLSPPLPLSLFSLSPSPTPSPSVSSLFKTLNPDPDLKSAGAREAEPTHHKRIPRLTQEQVRAAIAAVPGIDTPGFRVAFDLWLRYRDEQRYKPYMAIGLHSCLVQLAKIGPERAIAAIEHTMGKGWQGILEEAPGRGASAAPKPSPPSQAEYKPDREAIRRRMEVEREQEARFQQVKGEP